MEQELQEILRDYGLDPRESVWVLRTKLQEKLEAERDPMDRLLLESILRDLPLVQ
ncbi:hypothetical protein [Thiomonas sp.]